jgi:hypothetical protein
LVISRAITIGRLPSAAVQVGKGLEDAVGALEKHDRPRGACQAATSRSRRSFPRAGRNPANTTPSKSRPLAESAAVSALAPGMGMTDGPASRTLPNHRRRLDR